MSELKITHTLGSHVDISWGDVTLFRYVHHPDVPQLESPKPYLHPVHTLAGDLVTAYRPHDHVWHKGIQLALPHVGQENFWGGVTWIRGKGYEQIDNNGSMDHAGFEALEADGDRALIDERLQWHTQAGEHWIDERRALAVRVLDDATWVLTWSSELENRSGQDLVLGSPTTNGRPNAGYGGLLWRGPRCFTGGDVLTPEGVRDQEDVMGTSGPWVAYLGTQDETMRRQTLAFFSDAGPPWFVRSSPFAVVGPAPWFHEEETLASGDTLELRCEIAIADGAWTAQDVSSFRAGGDGVSVLDPLPGAVGVSHLAVYDESGSPHVHLTCTEAYIVQSGEGSVQTLGPDGYEEIPLRPMDIVWFTPGIIHRLINPGDLQLLVLMQNSGLPEAGDAVFTFPRDVLRDPDEYARCAALPPDRERRDLAIEGFAELRDGGLDDFYAAALLIVAPRLDEWEAKWRDGALAAAERTGEQLSALKAGDSGVLREARLHRGYANEDPRKLGMCGRLATLEMAT